MPAELKADLESPAQTLQHTDYQLVSINPLNKGPPKVWREKPERKRKKRKNKEKKRKKLKKKKKAAINISQVSNKISLENGNVRILLTE